MKSKFLKAGLLAETLIISAIGLCLSAGIASADDTGLAADASVVEALPQEDAEMIMDHKAHHRAMKEEMREHKEMRMEGRILKLDTNEDGKVDLSEWLSNSEQRFNEMDLNGDQFVTPDEARENHKLMRDKHRELKAQRHQEHRKAMQERDKAKAQDDAK